MTDQSQTTNERLCRMASSWSQHLLDTFLKYEQWIGRRTFIGGDESVKALFYFRRRKRQLRNRLLYLVELPQYFCVILPIKQKHKLVKAQK